MCFCRILLVWKNKKLRIVSEMPETKESFGGGPSTAIHKEVRPTGTNPAGIPTASATPCSGWNKKMPWGDSVFMGDCEVAVSVRVLAGWETTATLRRVGDGERERSIPTASH